MCGEVEMLKMIKVDFLEHKKTQSRRFNSSARLCWLKIKS